LPLDAGGRDRQQHQSEAEAGQPLLDRGDAGTADRYLVQGDVVEEPFQHEHRRPVGGFAVYGQPAITGPCGELLGEGD
jgi:hypothetical protein